MSSKNQETLIKMKDLRGVFIILAIGLFMAGFVLIIEIFWFDCQRKFAIVDEFKILKTNQQRMTNGSLKLH